MFGIPDSEIQVIIDAGTGHRLFAYMRKESSIRYMKRQGSKQRAPAPLLLLIFFIQVILAQKQQEQEQASADGGTGKEKENLHYHHHFVLVHGLGHGAWCWYKVVTMLRHKGHRVAALDLNSNGINRASPSADGISSIAHYCQPLLYYLSSLPPHDKVTLVGHSLGGCAITYAMEMYPHKIKKVIFVAAFTPRNNESFLSSAYPETFPTLIANNVVELESRPGSELPISASFVFEDAKSFLYNESPEEDITLAESLLTPTPFAVSVETLNLSDDNYGSIRRFYIMLMKDRLFPPQHQEFVVGRNMPEKVFRMEASDHSPFFSQPRQLTNLLIHIATL